MKIDLGRWVGRIRQRAGQRNEIEQLRAAIVRAERANEAKSRFLANMSHEIRTPLAAIVGYADLIVADPGDQDANLYLETIKRSTEQLERLIGDILDVSRVEANQVMIELAEFDLSGLLTDVVATMKLMAKNKGIELRLDTKTLPSTIRSDRIRLKQILTNIIGNAIKFTQQGSVTITVSVTEDKDQMLCFVVKDCGPGVSKVARDRIFEPFEQESDQTGRKYGGSGLGLTLSRRLARALGGDVVMMESAVGATFLIKVATGQARTCVVPDPSFELLSHALS